MTTANPAAPHTTGSSASYELAHWCDFARGVADPGVTSSMGEALNHSESARTSVELFDRVRSVAEADQAAQIPPYALRVVKAVAGLERPRSWDEPSAETGWLSFLRFLPLRITFDSLQAAQAGTRDLASSHQRTTSYRAEDFSVHVRVELETNPHSQVVVGQLLRHDPEPRPVSEVPVLMLSNGRVVGRSLTSDYGEFQAAGLPPDSLELCLLVGSQDCIDVPLGANHPDA